MPRPTPAVPPSPPVFPALFLLSRPVRPPVFETKTRHFKELILFFFRQFTVRARAWPRKVDGSRSLPLFRHVPPSPGAYCRSRRDTV